MLRNSYFPWKWDENLKAKQYIYIYIKYVYIAYKAKLTEGRRIFLKFMMPYYNRKPQFPIFEMRK